MAFNQTVIITCYGQNWSRDGMIWNPSPEISNCSQQPPKIDFSKQI